MDKIAFAQLIAYIGDCVRRQTVDVTDIRVIDEMLDPQMHKADPITLNHLMDSLKHGRFIDAIKDYRILTGFGLKEAKDAIEANRPYAAHELKREGAKEIKQQMLDKINVKFDDRKHLLEDFTEAQKQRVYAYIESFSL